MPTLIPVSQSIGLEQVARRVQAEFLECPGLRLTRLQAQRFWNLEPDTCGMLLDALELAHVLQRTAAGAYRLVDNR